MTIGELSSRSGVPASTLRYWERIGVLPPPLRISGQRRYGSEALPRLAILRLAQRCGFSLSDMRRLVEGFGSDVPPAGRWREQGRSRQRAIDEQIARLEVMRGLVNRLMRCECLSWAECGGLAVAELERA